MLLLVGVAISHDAQNRFHDFPNILNRNEGDTPFATARGSEGKREPSCWHYCAPIGGATGIRTPENPLRALPGFQPGPFVHSGIAPLVRGRSLTWRRDGDLNPGGASFNAPTRFRVAPLRPLGHPSEGKILANAFKQCQLLL